MEDTVTGIEFLTLPEVAAVLRCSRSTVYKLVESGKLKANRIGGRLIFDRTRLLVWIEAHSTSSDSEGKRGVGV
jgi:excisionase family DNA binding protein